VFPVRSLLFCGRVIGGLGFREAGQARGVRAGRLNRRGDRLGSSRGGLRGEFSDVDGVGVYVQGLCDAFGAVWAEGGFAVFDLREIALVYACGSREGALGHGFCAASLADGSAYLLAQGVNIAAWILSHHIAP